MSRLSPLSFFSSFPCNVLATVSVRKTQQSRFVSSYANSSSYEHSIIDFSLQRKHASRFLSYVPQNLSHTFFKVKELLLEGLFDIYSFRFLSIFPSHCMLYLLVLISDSL